MPRLLIVSNRLPITVRLAEGGAVSVEPSTGGLATGMKGPHERLGGLWIGWPGDLERLPDGARREVDRRLAELRLAGVPLSADEIARYYEGYSNAILWPLFHYSVARLPNEVSGFDTYEQVNARFADEVAARWQPGDLVWIHDYQLMLVPAMLRERVPDARIGFFLHIPFPSSEIFRLLPQRERLLEGLLGADLLGFHTATYLRHFASAALRLVGATTEVDRLRWQGREVRMGVFPMGIDAAHFSALASSPEVEELEGEPPPRGPPAPARPRPARLHEGHPAPAARLRGPPARAPGADPEGPARAGGGALARERRGVPGAAGGGGRARRPHPWRVRHPGLVAHSLPVPRPVAGRDRRALPGDRRGAGDPAPGRNEPRREGVCRGPQRWGRRPGPLRVRRGRGRDDGGPPGESVRRPAHGGGLLPGPHAPGGGAAHPARAPARAGDAPRRARVGEGLHRAPRAGGGQARVAGAVAARGAAPGPGARASGGASGAPARLRRHAGPVRCDPGAGGARRGAARAPAPAR